MTTQTMTQVQMMILVKIQVMWMPKTQWLMKPESTPRLVRG